VSDEDPTEFIDEVLDGVFGPVPKRVFKAPAGECGYCDKQKEGGFFPPHDASVNCESGRHNHCTCDTCF
jgi:hypothetical protein